MFADDQSMDVVGAFVGFYRLQDGHMAEDGLLASDAIAAEGVATNAGSSLTYFRSVPIWRLSVF